VSLVFWLAGFGDRGAGPHFCSMKLTEAVQLARRALLTADGVRAARQ